MRIGVNGRFLAAVPTGVQRFALEIARRVLAGGDALLLVPGGVAVPAGLAPGERVRRGVLFGHAWEQVELPRLARRAGCDVTLHLANALPARAGPHAVVLHDTTVFRHPEWFGARYRLWHHHVLLPALRRAAALGTVSRASQEELVGPLGRSPEEIAVISQGAAPLDAPASPAAVAEVRRRLGMAGPYLLAVGAGDPRKNVPFLERVLARWAALGESPPRLVLVGEGVRHVFAPAAGTGADGPGGRLLRAGRVDDETLRALYTGAAAFCFPSLAEGFGRPPLEALACGAPVLAAPYPSAREVLGDAALLLPLEEEAWARALQHWVREGPPRELAGRAHAVVARHRWEDGAATTLELCARAAQLGRQGGAGNRPARRSARQDRLGAGSPHGS